MTKLAWLATTVLLLSGCSDNAAARAASSCREHAQEWAGLLNGAANNGALRRGDRNEINESDWLGLAYSMKVNMVFALFCTEADADGGGKTLLYGLHDGKIKATMTDGEYADGGG